MYKPTQIDPDAAIGIDPHAAHVEAGTSYVIWRKQLVPVCGLGESGACLPIARSSCMLARRALTDWSFCNGEIDDEDLLGIDWK